MTVERRTLVIEGKAYTVPLIGQRCPRCHRPAPRLDGVPCRLCAPTGGTLTDPKTGITHQYRTGCLPLIDLAGLKLKHFNVGPVPVTCFECIAKLEEDPVSSFTVTGRVTDDVVSAIKVARTLSKSGLI